MTAVTTENQEPKTIVYDYLFNYFGGDTYEGRTITGASVNLAIKAYKNGKEIKSLEEPEYNDTYLSDVFKVSFDKKNLFNVERNLKADNLFRLAYGFDKIEAEIVGFELYRHELPEEVEDVPCEVPIQVTEEVFRQFLMSHKNDFDIKDNKNAQVPSVAFI